MGHFRLGCDSPPSRFLQTRSCKLCPSKRTGGEDASIQKLLDLQRWPRHRLGGCSDTHTDDPGQRGRADHPVGLFRLLYRLGVNDDCPIRLSAAKALGVEPLKGVISSIDPPCGPRASDTQLTVVCRNNFPHSDEKIWAETCRFHLTCSAPPLN